MSKRVLVMKQVTEMKSWGCCVSTDQGFGTFYLPIHHVVFLNANELLLDVANAKGQIFILTTNYIDRLDPTMIRSGRVDLRIEVRATYMAICAYLPFKHIPHQSYNHT